MIRSPPTSPRRSPPATFGADRPLPVSISRMPMSVVPVAVVQDEVPATLDHALDRTADLAREAAARGASLIVFPETWIPGYPVWLDVCRDAALWDHAPVKQVFRRLAANSVVVDGPAGRRLGEVAREVGATLVVGVSERVESGPGRGTLYNALLTYGPDGTLLNHHRKLVPTYTERMVWGGGDGAGLRAVDTPRGGSAGSSAGSTGCRCHARRCTTRARTSMWPPGPR